MSTSKSKARRLVNAEVMAAKRGALLITLADLPPIETDKTGGQWIEQLRKTMADLLGAQGRPTQPESINPFQAEPCAMAVLIGTVSDLDAIRGRLKRIEDSAEADGRALVKLLEQSLPELGGRIDSVAATVEELKDAMPAPDPEPGLLATLIDRVTQLEEKLQELGVHTTASSTAEANDGDVAYLEARMRTLGFTHEFVCSAVYIPLEDWKATQKQVEDASRWIDYVAPFLVDLERGQGVGMFSVAVYQSEFELYRPVVEESSASSGKAAVWSGAARHSKEHATQEGAQAALRAFLGLPIPEAPPDEEPNPAVVAQAHETVDAELARHKERAETEAEKAVMKELSKLQKP